MVDKTLAYLDFSRLLDVIRKHSSITFGEDDIGAIRPLSDRAAIMERLDRTEALIGLVQWNGRIPFSTIPDIRPYVKRSVIRGSSLEPKELLAVADFLDACAGIGGFLKTADHRPPYVENVIERIERLPDLYARIRKTINPDGFIEDSASYELSRIRAELFSYRERIRRQLERMMETAEIGSVLQDNYISIRNGRYVIPLKPNFNQAIQGIVHDHSHSLKTSFVEPVAIVELNNAANILDKEEKEEEKRILQDLTVFVGQRSETIVGNLMVIKELDLYHSLALFAEQFACLKPDISVDGQVNIRGARNPFIMLSKPGKAVPIDIVMEPETDVMIISGPNAGGKTAALKTMGLLSLMAAAGLFVPAEGQAKIPLFPKIFAVLGDEQDISMELSSFSAHISAIRDVLSRSGPHDLVLVDEIGGGTEPQEASALAMALMDAFVKKRCRLVVTTHLNLLKAYGYTRAFAMNVACAFEHKTMQPLYRLLYNTAGYSNAISVAETLGLSESIIAKSREYLGNQEQMLAELVASLESQKLLLEAERQEASLLREEARKRLNRLKEERVGYLKGFSDRLDARLRDVEDEIEEIRKEVARKEKGAIRIARGKLDNLRIRQGIQEPRERVLLAPGDYVWVKSLGGTGRIASVDADRDMYEVVLGNVKTRVPRRYLEKRTPDRKASDVPVEIEAERLDVRELDLLGMRVDDAMEALDKFVDKAVLEGLDRVKVRHGIGTGRLMKAVRSHLADSSLVAAIHSDEHNAGITIVEFR